MTKPYQHVYVRGDRLKRSAVFSQCRKHRYMLTREWVGLEPTSCCFVMLNPSTADENFDDPTIRRCIDFADRFGHNMLRVVNVFALRATNPEVLRCAEDPVGANNLATVRSAVESSNTVVCAWGSHDLVRHGSHNPYIKTFMQLLIDTGKPLYCLGTNKNGSPKHPLYIRGSTALIRWEPVIPKLE